MAGLVATPAWQFQDLILVDCPRCGGCARVTLVEPASTYKAVMFGPRRMVCTACSAVRTQDARTVARTAMGLPLRLRAEVRKGVLWFYNLRHLDHVRAYIAASRRLERVEPGGVRNGSVLSRLPAWSKAGGARMDVLAAIDEARRRAC